MNRAKLRKVVSFFCNPRLILCLLLAWVITNGWSYIMLGIGVFFDIAWMVTVAGMYITFLWLPISPEKVVTVAIAMVLLRFFFPGDQKTLAVLRDFYAKFKDKRQKKSKKQKGSSISEQNDQAL